MEGTCSTDLAGFLLKLYFTSKCTDRLEKVLEPDKSLIKQRSLSLAMLLASNSGESFFKIQIHFGNAKCDDCVIKLASKK